MGSVRDVQQAESRVREAVAAHKTAIKNAEKIVQERSSDLRSVGSRCKETIRTAEKSLRQAEKSYESNIKSIEKKMASVEKAATRRLGSYSNITLFADRVVGSGTTLSLNENVDAKIETGGNVYSYTGLLAGLSHNWYASDVRDKRTLSITIDSSEGRITAMGKPDEEKQAREFAALVATTAAKAKNALAARDAELEKLRLELAAAEADTSAIKKARAALASAREDPAAKEAVARAEAAVQAAEAALEAVKNDTSAIDAAQQALDEAKARTPQAELDAYEKAKSYNSRKKVIAILLLLVIALFAVIVVAYLVR